MDSMAVFEPHHLTEEDLPDYGMEKRRTLINFYIVFHKGRIE